MEIKIEETGEEVELTIIDPRSGVDWISDLLGNHNVVMQEGGGIGALLEMSQEDYDWWSDLTERYQIADFRYYDLRKTLPDDDSGYLVEAVENLSCDLEDYPELLQQICDDFDA